MPLLSTVTHIEFESISAIYYVSNIWLGVVGNDWWVWVSGRLISCCWMEWNSYEKKYNWIRAAGKFLILYESSIVCVQQLLPNQSRGNANFYALYDHEASLPKCFLAHYMVITVGCEWSPCLFLLIIFIKINMVLIYIGFSWWTFGASPKFCSHDWRKCRHILCDEKDTRARGHPGQVIIISFYFLYTSTNFNFSTQCNV